VTGRGGGCREGAKGEVGPSSRGGRVISGKSHGQVCMSQAQHRRSKKGPSFTIQSLKNERNSVGQDRSLGQNFRETVNAKFGKKIKDKNNVNEGSLKDRRRGTRGGVEAGRTKEGREPIMRREKLPLASWAES